MAWVEITEADVRAKLSDAEIARYRQQTTAAGRVDTLPALIAEVVNEARGYVGASGRYVLGQGTTIPSKLVGACVAIIRYRFLNAMPGQTVSEDRKTEYEDAKELLSSSVATGKFGLEEPMVATSEGPVSALGPSMRSRSREFTRTNQDGV